MTSTAYELDDVMSDSQWERALAIRNFHFPFQPVTVPEAKQSAKASPADIKKRRVLVTQGGKDVGYLVMHQLYWAKGEERENMAAHMSPNFRENGEQNCLTMIQAAEDLARGFNAPKLTIWSSSEPPIFNEVLQRSGYTKGQLNPVSRLALADFDEQQMQETCPLPEGIEAFTLETLMERFPDWKRRAWELDGALMKDVPLPEELDEIPFESFANAFENPSFDPTMKVFALDGDQWIGQTALWRAMANPDYVWTELTGTRREYRRRGIAKALKVRAISEAKRRGATDVFTDNEENNPMLQLNYILGFKPFQEYAEFTKVLG